MDMTYSKLEELAWRFFPSRFQKLVYNLLDEASPFWDHFYFAWAQQRIKAFTLLMWNV